MDEIAFEEIVLPDGARADGVYAIAAGPFFKIGQTQNIRRRRWAIEAGGPYATTLVGWWPGDDRMERESVALECLREWRARGEWFHRTPGSSRVVRSWVDTGLPERAPAQAPVDTRPFRHRAFGRMSPTAAFGLFMSPCVIWCNPEPYSWRNRKEDHESVRFQDKVGAPALTNSAIDSMKVSGI
jgi:hypothetical protein